MPNFNSIGSGVSEPQVAENRYLPLTGGIALTTVYARLRAPWLKGVWRRGLNAAWHRAEIVLM